MLTALSSSICELEHLLTSCLAEVCGHCNSIRVFVVTLWDWLNHQTCLIDTQTSASRCREMIRCRGAACVPHCCRVQIGRLLQQAVIFSTTNQQRDKELKILSRLKVLFSNQIKKNRKAHLSFVGVSAQLCQKVVFVFRTRGTGRFNAARARARARGVGQQFQWDDRDEQLGCHRASADDWTMCLCGASMCGLLWSHCDDFEGGYSGCHQEFLLQC